MTKAEFLAAVRARLAGLPTEDIERSVEYYGEMIDDRMEDGMNEQEAVAAVGTVEEAVSKIETGLPRPPVYFEPVMPASDDGPAPAGAAAPRRVAPWKIILPVVAAVIVFLFLAGLRSTVGGSIVGQTNTHEVEGAFSDIDIRTVEADVALARSEDGLCRVICRDAGHIRSAVSVEDGVLTVRREDDRPRFLHLFNCGFREVSVTVFLPKDVYGDIRVETVSGDIRTADAFEYAHASLTTTSGDIAFSGLAEGAVSVKTVSGDVWVQDTAADTLSVTTTSGDIWLSRNEVGALEAATTSGESTCDSVAVSGRARIETVSGDVGFFDSDAGSLRIKTVSGDVGALLLSPKLFSVSTVSGDVRVPPSDTAAGECSIATTSGDIDVSLAER